MKGTPRPESLRTIPTGMMLSAVKLHLVSKVTAMVSRRHIAQLWTRHDMLLCVISRITSAMKGKKSKHLSVLLTPWIRKQSPKKLAAGHKWISKSRMWAQAGLLLGRSWFLNASFKKKNYRNFCKLKYPGVHAPTWHFRTKIQQWGRGKVWLRQN